MSRVWQEYKKNTIRLISIVNNNYKSISTVFYITTLGVTLEKGKTTYSNLPSWGLVALVFAIYNLAIITYQIVCKNKLKKK